MNTSSDMLGNSKSGGQSVDCSGRVCENGEFSDSEVVTNDGDII
jgi:hypothetical protein